MDATSCSAASSPIVRQPEETALVVVGAASINDSSNDFLREYAFAFCSNSRVRQAPGWRLQHAVSTQAVSVLPTSSASAVPRMLRRCILIRAFPTRMQSGAIATYPKRQPCLYEGFRKSLLESTAADSPSLRAYKRRSDPRVFVCRSARSCRHSASCQPQRAPHARCRVS